MYSLYRIEPETKGGVRGFRAWFVRINGQEKRSEIWRETADGLREAMHRIYDPIHEVTGGGYGGTGAGTRVGREGLSGVRAVVPD
jgi:hypothetical protein